MKKKRMQKIEINERYVMKKEKISPQEQRRNEAYNEYVKQVTPTHNLWTNMFKAFLLGGFICLI